MAEDILYIARQCTRQNAVCFLISLMPWRQAFKLSCMIDYCVDRWDEKFEDRDD